ncbi:MAG TPA: GMC family oxidoreductase [Leucothrix mucor]|uniref:GMC family oxidoreductase n=1 Tax=Leucothrix mucor TaxID=45248 RepID=A0A7V2T509_LEUMU|nr:GMC family oxidoreductase [Leucothrix mucor]
MSKDFDVCVIGSGAGGGPIAYELSKAGHSVVVLEKGRWFKEDDFYKDEMACCIHEVFTPNLKEEQHVVETERGDDWRVQKTSESSWNLWNGNIVGGSSNFMSGFFHRLKPIDFNLKSTFGAIEGANMADWPISYDDLEPYYDKVEKVVGISGKVVKHKHQEPRSSKDFPYPPLGSHPLSKMIDKACDELGIASIPMPRAILSKPALGRSSCSYNGYCGGLGCATGAKGSSRAALLDKAVTTGQCEIYPQSHVSRILSDEKGQITSVEYYNKDGKKKHIDAKIYVVACQSIETARLLLNSTGKKHPKGLANSSGLVGQNLMFAGGGAGSGRINYAKFSAKQVEALRQNGPFINRTIHDYYVIDDPDFGDKAKGGVIDFVHLHPNPLARASGRISGRDGLIWGKPLKRDLETYFREGRYIKIEAFCDWLPNENSFVKLDPKVKDKYGMPVARARFGFHGRNLQVGYYLAAKAGEVLKKMGASNVISFASGSPPVNLVAGTCRFGNDPKTSVLNKDCQAHDVDNLYITDGSFMPNAGSAPFTWTIYANSFRVADKIIKRL